MGEPTADFKKLAQKQILDAKQEARFHSQSSKKGIYGCTTVYLECFPQKFLPTFLRQACDPSLESPSQGAQDEPSFGPRRRPVTELSRVQFRNVYLWYICICAIFKIKNTKCYPFEKATVYICVHLRYYLPCRVYLGVTLVNLKKLFIIPMVVRDLV